MKLASIICLILVCTCLGALAYIICLTDNAQCAGGWLGWGLFAIGGPLAGFVAGYMFRD